MRTSIWKYSGLLLIVLMGCTTDFEEINTDPNNPNVVPADYLLTHAETALGNAMFSLDMAGNTFVQYIVSQGIYSAYNVYAEIDPRDNSFSTARDHVPGLYDGVLMELQEIINLTSSQDFVSEADQNLVAVARLLKAYTYQLMTDSWGDIPYFEALKGVEEFTVPYDEQSRIYQDLLNEIDESLSVLDAGGGSVAGDIIYGGNAAQWILFGNSLKLRVAMRMSEVDPQTARTAAVDAIEGGVITANEDNAIIAYIASSGNDFIARFIGLSLSAGGFGTSTFIDYMQQTADPRLSVYFNPAASDGEYTGLPFGLRQYNFDQNEVSFIDAQYTNQDAEYLLITAEEMLFLQAEMIARGWIQGDAATVYQAAISRSLEKFSIAEDAIAAFLEQPEVAFQEDNPLASIATQKWVGLYFQGANAWAEWRRLRYPELAPAPEAINNIEEIPSRIPYPINERFLNESAYQSAVSRQGGDTYQTRVWWDVE